jgi:protein-disulfide isomerase
LRFAIIPRGGAVDMTVLAIARRTAVLALAAFSLAACSGGSKSAAGFDQDMTLGDSKAPVTVIEYASTSCPHCARYNSEDLPALKKQYIDTGKVYYVFREVPIHPSLDGPAYMLAGCVSKDKFFNVIDAIMRGQAEYYAPSVVNGPNPDDQIAQAFRAVLLRTAESQGLSDDQAMKCMSDSTAAAKLSDRLAAEAKEYDVNSTPTFIVNGKKVDQPDGTEMSNALVFPAINQALAKKKG